MPPPVVAPKDDPWNASVGTCVQGASCRRQSQSANAQLLPQTDSGRNVDFALLAQIHPLYNRRRFGELHLLP